MFFKLIMLLIERVETLESLFEQTELITGSNLRKFSRRKGEYEYRLKEILKENINLTQKDEN